MELAEAMKELYLKPAGFRVECEDELGTRVTLYRNKRGIKITPIDAPIHAPIQLAPRASQDEPGEVAT